jgi:hypothetical protein
MVGKVPVDIVVVAYKRSFSEQDESGKAPLKE